MQEAVVLGLGVSGRGVARLLLSQGYTVYGVDEKQSSLDAAQALGIHVTSDLSTLSLKPSPLIIASPGIHPHSKLYQHALRFGPVVGEAEYCLQGAKQPIIAITGTNGKTTVTKMVEHILIHSGKKAKAVGNVGLSFGEYFVSPDPSEILVAEMSSYQTEILRAKVIDIGILLNVTPDHLDRHQTMNAYFAAKWQLYSCVKPDGQFFVHESVDFPTGLACRYGLDGSYFFSDKDGKRCQEMIDNIFPMRYRQLPRHEQLNAIGAWLVVQTFGVSQQACAEALETFKWPPHRLEFVTTIDEVHYFNDSKGTNVDAVIKSVEAMAGPVVLIAGGVDKGSSYQCWKEPFAGKVEQVFAIGEAAAKIRKDLEGFVEVRCVESLEKAVKEASRVAKPRGQVLLSPGCSSFDMFDNYAHRGEAFKRVVYSLTDEVSALQ